ncbi:MAG: calcium-binding protein [Myxococcota bacterium]
MADSVGVKEMIRHVARPRVDRIVRDSSASFHVENRCSERILRRSSPERSCPTEVPHMTLSLSLWLNTALAAPTISDCSTGDAPSPYFAADCDIKGSAQVCTYANGHLVCDPDLGVCEGGLAIMAVNFESSSSISVFGQCEVQSDLATFCCLVDDPNGDINTFDMFGTSENDERIAFRFQEIGGPLRVLAPTGSKLVATAHGRDGDDSIDGSDSTEAVEYSEYLLGDGGVDNIAGFAGDDVIYGGSEADTLNGGTGEDWIYGEGGNDTIYGGGDDDHLYGGTNIDTIRGEGGDDWIWGGPHNDLLYGDAGHDWIFGQNGVDELRGGIGDDHLHAGNGDETVILGEDGHDVLYGGRGSDVLDGGSGTDTLCENHHWGSVPCAASNTFFGGSGGGDMAYIDGTIEFGSVWCPSMQLLGSNIEVASESTRDWSSLTGSSPLIIDGEPAACTEIMTIGGQ